MDKVAAATSHRDFVIVITEHGKVYKLRFDGFDENIFQVSFLGEMLVRERP